MELQVLIESEKPHESVKLINSEPIQVKDFENYLMASLEDNSLTDQYKVNCTYSIRFNFICTFSEFTNKQK
jgi:hypothetical protein